MDSIQAILTKIPRMKKEERAGSATDDLNAVPFGGTITHHRMPPNTVTACVAYFWRGKDKPTFWVYIGGMTHRRASLTGVHLIGVHLIGVHLIGVHPRRASLTGVHLMRASHRRVSLTGVYLLRACIL